MGIFFSIYRLYISIKVVHVEYVGNNAKSLLILPADLVNIPSLWFCIV